MGMSTIPNTHTEILKPSLRTASLSVQHEYALYIGDEPQQDTFAIGDMVTFVNTAGTTYLCQVDALRSGKIYAFGYAAHVPHQWFYQRVDQLPTLQRAEPGAAFPSTPDRDWIKQMRDDQLGDFDVADDRPQPYCQWNGIDQLNPDIR